MPARHATSWTPWIIRPAYGVEATRSLMNPIVCVRRVRSPRARGLGSYPSAAAASVTRWRVSSATRAPSTALSTTETVDGDTPASAATSLIPGGLPIATCRNDLATLRNTLVPTYVASQTLVSNRQGRLVQPLPGRRRAPTRLD